MAYGSDIQSDENAHDYEAYLADLAGITDAEWADLYAPAPVAVAAAIVSAAAAPIPAPAPVRAVTDFSRVIAMFDAAASRRIRAVKVRLPGLLLRRASGRSRFPGAVDVTDGNPYGVGLWFGRITREGRFMPGRDCTARVRATLEEFAANPGAVAHAYGNAMSRCSFCNLELTDARSVRVGYGEICATNFGLPWGERECVAA